MQLARIMLVLGALAASGSNARAHAIVLSAAPHAQETVAAGDVGVEIRFNSRIDAARSSLKLYKADGSAVALPVLAAEAAETLTSRATGLTPGDYRLHWQTLSPDGHISQGDIPFSVTPSSAPQP